MGDGVGNEMLKVRERERENLTANQALKNDLTKFSRQ